MNCFNSNETFISAFMELQAALIRVTIHRNVAISKTIHQSILIVKLEYITLSAIQGHASLCVRVEG